MAEYGMNFGGQRAMLGDRYTGGQGTRLANLLARQNYNNGSTYGGLATIAQGLLQGLALKQDADAVKQDRADYAAADQAFTAGISAPNWKPPKDEFGRPEQVWSGPTSDPNARVLAQNEISPNFGKAGGYEGGIARLGQPEFANNPYAGKLSRELVLGKMAQDETRRIETAKLNAPREMAAGTTLYDPKTNAALFTAPREDKPLSNIGQLNADLQAGRISRGDYSAAVKKLTHIENNGNGGPFSGNGMDAQVGNALLNLGPKVANGTATAQEMQTYNYAYSHATQPRVVGDPVSGFRMVTPALPSGLPNPNAQQPAPGPQGGVPSVMPQGQPQQQPTPAPDQMGAPPVPVGPGVSAPPRGPSMIPQVPGNTAQAQLPIPSPTVSSLGQGTGISPADRTKLNSAVEGAATIVNALDDYKASFGNAGFGDRVQSALGMNTPLNTSFSNAALLAKGEELYNLGVLNGPDLEIIQKTMADPSTFKGALTDPSQVNQSVQKVVDLIQNRLSARQMQLGLPVTNITEHAAKVRAATPTAAGSATTPGSERDAAQQEIERRKRSGTWGNGR